ncbi:MAG TPA: hypothetical protein VK539_36170 [Myxococcaceae bacterium]|nr:hypothetical protein [Myxococcaceae bacterium]
MSAASPEPTDVSRKVYRLRPSVHFAPLEAGVFFKSWSRSFSFKGHASLYPLFERLLPHLEKGVRVGDLLGAVPENVRRVISTLLEQLASHEMLLDMEGLSRPPPGPEAEAFASAISYLESVAADPYAAFARLRQARVLVGGAGPGLFACVRSLAAMGIGHLTCATDEAEPLAALLKQHSLLTSELIPAEALTARASQAPWSLVVHLPREADVQAVARLEAGTASPLLQALVGESLGVLGPVGHREGHGLGAALTRMGAPLGRVGEASPILATYLGNLAAFEAFKRMAGVPSATQQKQCGLVQRESLVSSFHAVEPLAAPAETDAQSLRLALKSFQRSVDAVDRKALIGDLQPLTDEFFGLVGAPHPGNLPQMPLFVCASTPRAGGQPVLGFARSADEASEHALLAAFRQLAEAGAAEVVPVLELRTEESLRLARQPWLSMASGFSYAEWLESGLRASLLRHIARESDLKLEVRATTVELGQLASSAGPTWKTLSLRLGRRVSVHQLSLPAIPGFHAIAVLEGERTLGLAAALNFEQALERALQEAIVRVQLEASTPQLPERASLRQRVEQAATSPVNMAAGSLEEVLAALERAGLSVLVHPWLGEPGIIGRGLLLGWVGIHGR